MSCCYARSSERWTQHLTTRTPCPQLFMLCTSPPITTLSRCAAHLLSLAGSNRESVLFARLLVFKCIIAKFFHPMPTDFQRHFRSIEVTLKESTFGYLLTLYTCNVYRCHASTVRTGRYPTYACWFVPVPCLCRMHICMLAAYTIYVCAYV